MFCCAECDSKILLTLKPNICCFCHEQHYQHILFCMKVLNFQQQAYNLRTRTESLKPCIQLFVPIKREFFEPILFQNKSQQRGISQRLLDKYSHVFISISLKQTLSSGRKPVSTVKTLISEQIAFVFYFGQVFAFCRLINESVLEWFLLIICK